MTSRGNDRQAPMYLQVEQAVLAQMNAGALQAGDQLPTEAELMERFKVSRITAKRALDNLVQQGLAFRQQGKGTFVARSRIREISGFRSFSEDIRARGLRPTSRLLVCESTEPDPDLRMWLQLPEGEQALLVRRVRLADGEPVAVENAYLPTPICPSLAGVDLETGSLYEALEQRFGIVPAWADSVIEAREATAEEARLLAMPVGAPVLAARRITYAANYNVIECVDSVYRGNRFTFYTGRQRIN